MIVGLRNSCRNKGVIGGSRDQGGEGFHAELKDFFEPGGRRSLIFVLVAIGPLWVDEPAGGKRNLNGLGFGQKRVEVGDDDGMVNRSGELAELRRFVSDPMFDQGNELIDPDAGRPAARVFLFQTTESGEVSCPIMIGAKALVDFLILCIGEFADKEIDDLGGIGGISEDS